MDQTTKLGLSIMTMMTTLTWREGWPEPGMATGRYPAGRSICPAPAERCGEGWSGSRGPGTRSCT